MIEKLVSDLPEIYQPIYGQPELSSQVSRPCLDRLDSIARIHDALQHLLGRPLKVLDLGCAQGYFSLNLAQRGANVHGIDYLDKNIAVCNALAQAHPQLHVSFETGRVEDVIEHLEPGRYDLVLGLSVFHHIVHERGAEAVKTLLERAANQSGALIVELALREEPLYWASSQPQDPRTLLESIAFVHEVARHATHLAPIPRPLVVASNRYWILEDRAEQFDSWSADPHALAHGTHEGSRRYFFSADYILKLYRFDHPRGAHNKAEFKREAQFLQSPPKAFPVPALVAIGETETSAWLATQRLPGRLLLDFLREGVAIDSRAVLLAVLAQLAALEKVGLYHDDVRTWNVLVAENGTAHLIDYGSISNRAQDCVWPGNPFLSFFIFVHEVAAGVVDDPDPLRTISISPYGLPQPYRAWATLLWRRPLAEWSFQLMHQTLRETPTDGLAEPLQQPVEAWMKAIEEAMQSQKLFANHILQQANADKQQYHQVLMALADSHARELALLGESFKQSEQNFQEKLSLARLLEKQLFWAQEQLIYAEQRSSALEVQLAEQQQRAAAAEAFAQEQKQCAAAVEESARDQQKRISELGANSHHWWQQACALEDERNALRQSGSWRITAPLRFVAGLALHPIPTVRNGANRVIHRTINISQRPLSRLMAAVLRRPELSHRINQWLLRYPALYQQLLGVARRGGVVPGAPVYAPQVVQAKGQAAPELDSLTPRARQIYADLKTAIQNNKRTD